MSSAGKKRKVVAEEEEDPDNLLLKVPRESTAISDPSSIDSFVERLLLEGDEVRLAQIGPVEVMKKAIALNYQALECSLFMKKTVDSSQRKIKELEKALSTSRKESLELRSGLVASQKKERGLEKELKEVKAALKLEKETAEMVVEGYKEGFENVKKEKDLLLEQLEDIAIDSMMRNRCDLMKEYVAGKHVDWKPEKWIREYERRAAGLTSSSEDDIEDKGGEEMSKEFESDAIGMEIVDPVVEEHTEPAECENVVLALPDTEVSTVVESQEEVQATLPCTTDEGVDNP